jgi:D-alanyl-D-alanine carboxypeptidase (penicillin-binding protein 5/6)
VAGTRDDESMPAPSGPNTRALEWVDPTSIATEPAGATLVAPDLLTGVGMPRTRSAWIPGGILVAIAGGYVAATLLWPLASLPPTVSPITVEPAAATTQLPVWPGIGSAAIGYEGGPTYASTAERTQMASITKIITVMTVLDTEPLELGQTGREFSFTQADSDSYWDYLRSDESALDVPVDGVLTEYQMLEGIILGSAGNYTDRLAEAFWPTDADYVAAASAWLAKVGLTDITVVEPTGIDYGNTATPDALIRLAEIALQNPVVAEIAAKQTVELPGAGLVTNTNGIIGDPGVVGLKTGTLEGYNLLSAKDLDVAGTRVRAYAVTLNQESSEERDAASRSLYDQLAALLAPATAVPAGTEVATVTTMWGASTTVRTAADANVSLWQKLPTVTRELKLDDDTSAGARAGSLTVTGALGAATVDLELTDELPGPDAWWRLTHPVELFGLN